VWHPALTPAQRQEGREHGEAPEFESKKRLKLASTSQAESLLAAEKRTLEMIANGAGLPDSLHLIEARGPRLV
jgi:hypothetical protein